jgi:undecaprenyl-diphosphatase
VANAPKEDWGMLLLATAVAAVVSFIAVKWLLRYVQTHTFNAFGWYRIALAVVIFAFLMR